jgi:hypothetical protein
MLVCFCKHHNKSIKKSMEKSMDGGGSELYDFVTSPWLWRGKDPVLQIRKMIQRNNAAWASEKEFLCSVASLLTGGKSSARVLQEIVCLPGAVPITATDALPIWRLHPTKDFLLNAGSWWRYNDFKYNVLSIGDAIEVAKMNIASLRLDVGELAQVLIETSPTAKAQFCGRPKKLSQRASVVMDIINARWTHARAAWIAAVVCIAEPAPRPTKRLRNASGQYMKHA